MTPLAACPRNDTTIDEVARFFLESGIASSPVLDANGALAGFLSEKDLMAAMASPDCWRRPVQAVMRPNVISYEEDTPIRMIYDFFCRVSIHRVVITKNGRPTGTISHNCLLRWFRDRVINKDLILPSSCYHVSCECSTADMASALGPHSLDTEQATQSAE
jgi:predicted transcriptional regulator